MKYLLFSMMAHIMLVAGMVGVHWKPESGSPSREGDLYSVFEVQLVNELLVTGPENHEKSIARPSKMISAVSPYQQPSESSEPDVGDQGSTRVEETLEFTGESMSEDQAGETLPPIQQVNEGPRGDERMQFLQEVRNRLEKAKRYPWKARLKSLEGKVRLEFYINPLGKPEEVKVVESSGSETLDEEGLAIVERAGQFPHLPIEWENGIHISVPLVFKLNEL
ncbi:MAG: energy transducer TonB family protein [Nitrospiria bacterium]